MFLTRNSLREVVSGPGKSRHFPQLSSDIKIDTQFQADLYGALSAALSSENLNQTTQDMRNPRESGYGDDLQRKHKFLVQRVEDISNIATQPLVNHEAGNDVLVGLNSAWRSLMAFLNILAKDNLDKLERVLNLQKPAQV